MKSEILEVDLLKLIRACLVRWWQILFAAILGGAVALTITIFCVTPTYESTTKIYVNNSDLSLGNISISSGDITASNSLVKVYIELLNTKKTMDIINSFSGLDYDYRVLKGMIKASETNGTPILKITVTSTSPEEAHLIASTISFVLPGLITSTIQSSYAVVVDDAIFPTAPSGPSYAENTVLGTVIGAMLVAALIAVRELISVEIKSEDDVTSVTDIPIIGSVSDFNSKEHGGKYYREQYYYRPTR